MKLMHKMTALVLICTLVVALSGCGQIEEWLESIRPTTPPETTQPLETTQPTEPSETTETTVVTDPTETTNPILKPSVGQKGAPLLSNFDDDEGETAIAVIRDEEDVERDALTRDEVKVIAMSERNDETKATPEQKEELEAAYDSLVQAESLEETVPGLSMALTMMDLPYELTPEDLVIRDLFHVEPPMEALDMLTAMPGSTITLVFNLEEIMVGDFVAFLQYTPADNTWHMVNPETVEIIENGKVSAEFLVDVGTLAILVEKG